jgi:hypothetical protein
LTVQVWTVSPAHWNVPAEHWLLHTQAPAEHNWPVAAQLVPLTQAVQP